jgi:hypothetical protein
MSFASSQAYHASEGYQLSIFDVRIPPVSPMGCTVSVRSGKNTWHRNARPGAPLLIVSTR